MTPAPMTTASDRPAERAIEIESARKALLGTGLTVLKEEYQASVRRWADIERKAQILAATSSTLIGISYAFARTDHFAGLFLAPYIGGLGVVVLCFSTWRSIAALMLRETATPNGRWFSDEAARRLKRVVSGAETPGAADVELLKKQDLHWRGIVAHMDKSIADKAEHVRDAEALLACAVFLVALLAIVAFIDLATAFFEGV